MFGKLAKLTHNLNFLNNSDSHITSYIMYIPLSYKLFSPFLQFFLFGWESIRWSVTRAIPVYPLAGHSTTAPTRRRISTLGPLSISRVSCAPWSTSAATRTDWCTRSLCTLVMSVRWRWLWNYIQVDCNDADVVCLWDWIVCSFKYSILRTERWYSSFNTMLLRLKPKICVFS